MAGIIDTIYTYRFLKILSTKWENTDAYKFGIVDKEGTPLKKSSELTSASEKKSYTSFIRLVFKFKRMISTIPGGKSATARYGTALLLIKENQQEIEKMGLDPNKIKKTFKDIFEKDDYSSKYINESTKTIIYNPNDPKTVDVLIKHAIGRDMDVKETKDGVSITGKMTDHNFLSTLTNKKNTYEEITNTTGGVEGKEQPLGKKGEINKRKKEKEDEVIEKEKNNESSYTYQIIGNSLIRIDEKRVVKKRVTGNKRSKKREYVPTKRKTRTGRRKLRGGEKAKWKRTHKKAYRKSQTGSAKHKRKRSMKKSKAYRK